MTIGERIRFVRKQRKMTQMELAHACHIKERVMISHYETGRSIPSMGRIEEMAKALDVSPAWLCGWTVGE